MMKQMMEQLLVKMKAGHEEIRNEGLVKIKAYLEKMEANPEEMKPVAEHQKSLKKRPWWR